MKKIYTNGSWGSAKHILRWQLLVFRYMCCSSLATDNNIGSIHCLKRHWLHCKMTTSSAVSDENFVKMATFSLHFYQVIFRVAIKRVDLSMNFIQYCFRIMSQASWTFRCAQRNINTILHVINSLRPRQNGRRFADDTFKRIFLNENVRISIKISLKFFAEGHINNIPALVQIMAWRRPGDKPLFEPMMVSLLTHICVTRPQWVNSLTL